MLGKKSMKIVKVRFHFDGFNKGFLFKKFKTINLAPGVLKHSGGGRCYSFNIFLIKFIYAFFEGNILQ